MRCCIIIKDFFIQVAAGLTILILPSILEFFHKILVKVSNFDFSPKTLKIISKTISYLLFCFSVWYIAIFIQQLVVNTNPIIKLIIMWFLPFVFYNLLKYFHKIFDNKINK